jgi:hypothetical protein
VLIARDIVERIFDFNSVSHPFSLEYAIEIVVGFSPRTRSVLAHVPADGRPLVDRERHRADAEEIARIRDWARGAVVDAVEAIADERVRAALAAAGK